MNMQHTHKGYSLIELCVVIALVGVLMGSALSVGSTSTEKANLASTDTSLDEIEKAIQLFHNKNNRIPCPASPSQAENTANFGVEDNCSNAAPTLSGIVELNDGVADEQWMGVLPTRTLGLPDRMMYDKWGNRLVYGVQKNFADSTKNFSSEVANTLGTMIKIRDKSGNTINPSTVAGDLQNPVVYVLLTLGKDKRGAYNKAGMQPVSCAASNTQRDVQNCDFTVPATKNSIFLDGDISDSTTSTEYYYDKLRWKTKLNFGIKPISSLISRSPMYVSHGLLCAITPTGLTKCSGVDWGMGRLGNGLTGDVTVFTTEANGFTDWRRITGGYNGGCGIRSNGKAYCWGVNTFGELGDGTFAQKSTAVEVLGEGGTAPYTDWKVVSRGERTTCGIRTNGRAYCWGKNSNGAVGDGTYAPRSSPVQVLDETGTTSYTDWKHIITAQESTCGLRTNGRIYCWGDNTYGELGDATNTRKNIPVEISPATPNWVKLGNSNGYGACAIRNDGRAYCWGRDYMENLGNGGVLGDVNVPTEVTGNHTNWTDINYGLVVSCGLLGTGVAYCWGDDTGAAVGNNGMPGVVVNTPRIVSGGITDYKYITTYCSDHVCAARANGDVYCWGRNDSGQFGNGTTSFLLSAPTVVGITVNLN